MTQIEKIARLIFVDFANQFIESGWNPITNKEDLIDLENSLYSTVLNILPSRIEVWAVHGQYHAESVVYFDDHPDKFTARAHAVCAVAEKIYDKRT